DDVAEIDADPQLHAAVLGKRGVARLHALLHLDGALHGVDDAGEFDQHAVAHQLDETAAVFCEQRLEHLPAPLAKHGPRPGLVLAHEPAVADHVGGQNGGEAAFVGFAHDRCHRAVIEDRYGRVLRQAWHKPTAIREPSAPRYRPHK